MATTDKSQGKQDKLPISARIINWIKDHPTQITPVIFWTVAIFATRQYMQANELGFGDDDDGSGDDDEVVMLEEATEGGESLISDLIARTFTVEMLALIVLVRFLTTLLSYSIGAPGGIFAPLLALATGFGLLFHALCGTVWPSHFEGFESAFAVGFGPWRILWSDVLPNAFPPLLVATTMNAGRAILLESGLAFLGLGDANKPSWGTLLNEAQTHLQSAWWLTLFPGLAIFLVVLAINLLGDIWNDNLNPTLERVKS